MKKILIPLMVVFFAVACEKEEISTNSADQSVQETESTDKGNSNLRANAKVDICHYDVDNDIWEVITIDQNGWPAHQAHGDVQLVDADEDGWVVEENECVQGGDCDDTNAAINPGAIEICDGVDNNCDGQIDEGLPTNTYYVDADSDGYGDPATAVTDCAQPAGYIAQGGDCDDAVATTNPGAEEICGNGLDDDCDGLVDEDCCPPGSDGLSVITNNGLYWMTENLNENVPGSLCYNNDPANCTTNGRMYNLAQAQSACAQLGPCWRVPTEAEWDALVNTYGGYGEPSYEPLAQGGSSGFDALSSGGVYVPPSSGFGGFFSFELYAYYLSASPGSGVTFNPPGASFGGWTGNSSTGPDNYASCRCVKEIN